MTKDHIVEEVRRIREKQAAKCHFNIDAILAAAKKRQRKSGHKVVSMVTKLKGNADNDPFVSAAARRIPGRRAW
jgi:hypothetical protein